MEVLRDAILHDLSVFASLYDLVSEDCNSCRGVLLDAVRFARAQKQRVVVPLHLLLAPDNRAAQLLRNLGANLDALRADLEQRLAPRKGRKD